MEEKVEESGRKGCKVVEKWKEKWKSITPVRLEGDFQCSWENLITQSMQKAD